MRVAVVPADKTGCGTYRMILPASVVQKIRPDWKVELYPPGGVRIAMGPAGQLAMQGIADPQSLDLIVMQRVGDPREVAFIRWAQSQGIAVVVDSDDAMWCIDRDNQAWKGWNGRPHHWRYLDAAMELADMVTVTTPGLAKRYGAHGRCEVIPNAVPSEILDLPNLRSEFDPAPTFGWCGFVGTHPKDLQTITEAVHAILRDEQVRVRVIADPDGAEAVWGLPAGSVDGIPPQPLGPGFFSTLTSLDVAVVPLASSPFNTCKSALKALEFAALGVPVVAAATPANRALARSVPIVLAESQTEWSQRVSALLADPVDRKERAEAGRNAVRRAWTIESHGESWASAWERAVNRRQRMGTAG